jgi:outer membrane protein TolC
MIIGKVHLICRAVISVAVLLSGCSIIPVALKPSELEQIAAEAREKLFESQEPITHPLSLHEATARAIKYQADYRAKMMEQAVSLGQLNVAQFDLLPKLTANAGYSARNNESFGFGFTPGGGIAANPSASVEKQHTTASIGFTWSILDFGVSYYRAQQLADQSLIAEERRRKALQNLVQDVRLAWWRGEAAQRLLPQIDGLLDEIGQAIEKTRVIENRKLLPPLQTATLRRGLLDLEQQISSRRQELSQARIELASLINVPPGSEIKLAAPTQPSVALLEFTGSIDALESMALRNRPEISEETYKARVSEAEAKKAVLGLFPNFNMDVNRSYDSNRFLVNNVWNTTALGVAFNLVKAFSMPAVKQSAEAQRKLDEARRLAMAMAVLTQTRIATVRYTLLSHEFSVWDDATRDDEQIVGYLSSSAQVGIDTEFELIRAKARLFVSKINRELLHANLEAALGRIYNSVGEDALPAEIDSHETADLAKTLHARLEEWQAKNFTPKAAAESLPVMFGDIDGVPPKMMEQFRAAFAETFKLSKIRVASSPEEARLKANAAVTLDPPAQGVQTARIRVALLELPSQTVRFSSEFKTTLSEPVDVEQWRTLGEGAAYRMVGPLARLQAGRSSMQQGLATPWGDPPLRLSFSTSNLQSDSGSLPAGDANKERLPIALRLAEELALSVSQHVSRVHLDAWPTSY